MSKNELKGNSKMKTKNTNDTRSEDTIEKHEYNKPSLKLTDRSIKAIKTNFLTPTEVFPSHDPGAILTV